MNKFKLVKDEKIIEFATRIQAENFALANGVSTSSIVELDESIPFDLAQHINSRIEYFQSVAPKLVRELYVENTLAGITTAQSDQMFDDYADVLTRIKEGAFPTAIYRLQTKQPSGFVTQDLIDAWIQKIEAYLV